MSSINIRGGNSSPKFTFTYGTLLPNSTGPSVLLEVITRRTLLPAVAAGYWPSAAEGLRQELIHAALQVFWIRGNPFPAVSNQVTRGLAIVANSVFDARLINLTRLSIFQLITRSSSMPGFFADLTNNARVESPFGTHLRYVTFLLIA